MIQQGVTLSLDTASIELVLNEQNVDDQYKCLWFKIRKKEGREKLIYV